jgi:hypothetical protein
MVLLSVQRCKCGAVCFVSKGARKGALSRPLSAKEKPSPLSDAFNRDYFDTLFDEKTPKIVCQSIFGDGAAHSRIGKWRFTGYSLDCRGASKAENGCTE